MSSPTRKPSSGGPASPTRSSSSGGGKLPRKSSRASVRSLKRTWSTISGNSGIQKTGSYIWPDGTVDDTINLKPKITLLNGITVIVGSIIGSGIFVSPKGVLEQTGSVGLALIIWIACGLFSMVGAYCFTELGVMIVKSGGDYAYIHEAFGPFLAFLRLWVECIIVRPCTTAVVALTFAFYVVAPIFPDCDKPDDAVRLLAAVCLSRSQECMC